MIWPENKDFAFTIIDDTDAGTIENTKAVYEYLYEKGIFTTKTVWAYPARDDFLGDSLADKSYKEYIYDLAVRGFEIASHGPGSGDFTGEETIRSFEVMEKLCGYIPKIFINHASNKGNIYWAGKRFNPIVASLFLAVKKIRGEEMAISYGDEESSTYFWGDYASSHITYMRNHVFSGLDTLTYDSYMPYKEKGKEDCSNYWFSSSDGFDCKTFNRLLDPSSVNELVKNRGCAVVYTHFGYGFVKNGELDETFKERIDYLAKQNGWFVPASELLDYLNEKKAGSSYISSSQKLMLDLKWFFTRILRRIVQKV